MFEPSEQLTQESFIYFGVLFILAQFFLCYLFSLILQDYHLQGENK